MSVVTTCFLIMLLVASVVTATNDVDSPWNVAGFVDREVTLECNRNVTMGDTEWKYKAPGSDAEVTVPGRNYELSSSYDKDKAVNKDKLIIKELKLSNAGTYVCRSRSSAFKPAAAFAVVVADRPSCKTNITEQSRELNEGDAVKLTCAVAFISGQELQLFMMWTDSVNGVPVKSENFSTTAVGLSYQSLDVIVAATTDFLSRYTCEISFRSVHQHLDVAQNAPELASGNSCKVQNWLVSVRSFGIQSSTPGGTSTSECQTVDTVHTCHISSCIISSSTILLVILILFFVYYVRGRCKVIKKLNLPLNAKALPVWVDLEAPRMSSQLSSAAIQQQVSADIGEGCDLQSDTETLCTVDLMATHDVDNSVSSTVLLPISSATSVSSLAVATAPVVTACDTSRLYSCKQIDLQSKTAETSSSNLVSMKPINHQQ